MATARRLSCVQLQRDPLNRIHLSFPSIIALSTSFAVPGPVLLVFHTPSCLSLFWPCMQPVMKKIKHIVEGQQKGFLDVNFNA